MIQTCTKKDLVRCLYRETSLEESKAIQEVLEQDEQLQAEFIQMKEMKNKLSAFAASPSSACIDFILQYSLHTQKNTTPLSCA
ncbi:MAG: hypothetical protein IPL35_10140 [Sphingobacteriales bacterium]|nr:hypothetical protein [Sphingobacteriales bacterium]